MQTNNENRGKKILKDFGVYSIGVIGNRLISFLILPFYTYFISNPSDYGYYDLCLNVCLTLLPITTLQMRESAFRFLLNNDNEQSKEKIVSFIICSLLISFSVVVIASMFIYIYADVRFFVLAVIMLLSMTFFDTWLQMVRGLSGNTNYVNFSVVLSFLIFIMSVVLIAILRMGIEGIFLSMTLSRVLVFIYGEFKTHIIRQYFRIHINTRTVSKNILKYSLPLIPSAFLSSFLSTSNRFFIENYVSMHANGIYAVAFRFNMVMGAFALVFYQTWQETAFLQYNSKDRDEFFSKVFNYFLIILSFVLIISSFLLKINSWIIAEEYSEAFKYLFLIGIAQLFSSLSGSFFELGYQCSKETYREIFSALLVFVVNAILCFYLAPISGIYGVVTANIISYFVLTIYRYFETKRYFTIKIYNRSFFLIPIVGLGAILFELNYGMLVDCISLLFLLLSLYLILPKELCYEFVNSIKKKSNLS